MSPKETKSTNIMMRCTPLFKATVEQRAAMLRLDVAKYITALVEKDVAEGILPLPRSRRIVLRLPSRHIIKSDKV